VSEDMVNSPSHYNQSGIECIDAIRSMLGEEGFSSYCRGNAIKYTWRAGLKFDFEEDLKKAAWYNRMAAGDDPRKDKEFKPYEEQASLFNYKEKKCGVKGCAFCYKAVDACPGGSNGFVPPECDSRG